MTLPVPRPGVVIRYSFLWSHEASAGKEEAAKDRPCAIVLATRMDPSGDLLTIVAPITHMPPAEAAAALEIPPETRAALGIDGDAQWLRFDELNRFAWPGFDLRPIPGGAGAYDYGMLPKNLFEELKAGIIKRQKEPPVKSILRDQVFRDRSAPPEPKKAAPKGGLVWEAEAGPRQALRRPRIVQPACRTAATSSSLTASPIRKGTRPAASVSPRPGI